MALAEALSFKPGACGGSVGERTRDLQATARRREAIECRQHEIVQHRREGHGRIARQRIAKRQRPMCGQFGDEPVRQRLDGVVLVIFRFQRERRRR